jgi:hypothetical protein
VERRRRRSRRTGVELQTADEKTAGCSQHQVGLVKTCFKASHMTHCYHVLPIGEREMNFMLLLKCF